MGVYCLLDSIASHPARVGEIMEVVWFDHHGPVIFGDWKEPKAYIRIVPQPS